MLDRDDAPRGEALAVADAVDLVDDRNLRIAAEQEIGVQRMRQRVLDGAGGGDQRLADHLAAEHALPADLRARAAEQIDLELFEIEDARAGLGAAEDMETPSGGRSDILPPWRRQSAPAMHASERADVLIGGGGFAGLALAIALRQALGEPFKVIVADPAFGRAMRGDARASAIAAAARRLFETIGVWDEVADEAQPILDMVVTDSKLQDAMRPTYLTFARRDRAGRAVRPHDREPAGWSPR